MIIFSRLFFLVFLLFPTSILLANIEKGKWNFVKENDIDGITKINNIDVFFSLSLIKSFKDYNKTELKGYEFTAKYYFFVKEKIYLLLYQSKLINPGGYDLNKKEIYTLMEKRNNLGYLNEILQTLELK